ncbi:hypothetical protein BDW22DRAFT_1348947 [Trametopsis cervina]|nr:hypothetical protein BDW22DRAFT_1348947 [Trametopsis cervina]
MAPPLGLSSNDRAAAIWRSPSPISMACTVSTLWTARPLHDVAIAALLQLFVRRAAREKFCSPSMTALPVIPPYMPARCVPTSLSLICATVSSGTLAKEWLRVYLPFAIAPPASPVATYPGIPTNIQLDFCFLAHAALTTDISRAPPPHCLAHECTCRTFRHTLVRAQDSLHNEIDRTVWMTGPTNRRRVHATELRLVVTLARPLPHPKPASPSAHTTPRSSPPNARSTFLPVDSPRRPAWGFGDTQSPLTATYDYPGRALYRDWPLPAPHRLLIPKTLEVAAPFTWRLNCGSNGRRPIQSFVGHPPPIRNGAAMSSRRGAMTVRTASPAFHAVSLQQLSELLGRDAVSGARQHLSGEDVSKITQICVAPGPTSPPPPPKSAYIPANWLVRDKIHDRRRGVQFWVTIRHRYRRNGCSRELLPLSPVCFSFVLDIRISEMMRNPTSSPLRCVDVASRVPPSQLLPRHIHTTAITSGEPRVLANFLQLASGWSVEGIAALAIPCVGAIVPQDEYNHIGCLSPADAQNKQL